MKVSPQNCTDIHKRWCHTPELSMPVGGLQPGKYDGILCNILCCHILTTGSVTFTDLNLQKHSAKNRKCEQSRYLARSEGNTELLLRLSCKVTLNLHILKYSQLNQVSGAVPVSNNASLMKKVNCGSVYRRWMYTELCYLSANGSRFGRCQIHHNLQNKQPLPSPETHFRR